MKYLKNWKIMSGVILIAVLLCPHHYFIDGNILWGEIVKNIFFTIGIFIFGNIFTYLIENVKLKDYSKEKKIAKYLTILSFYLIPFIIIGIEWIQCFPANLSTDSYVQLQQIYSNNYSDVHPAAQTLFCKLLMCIYNSPATVIFFQILFLSIITGYGFQYFYNRGISKKILIPILLLWSSLGPVRIITCYFWKDVFYTIGILALTIVFIITIEKKEKTNVKTLILGGIALAVIALFRHNGMLVFVCLLPIFICWTIKFHKQSFIIPIGISIGIIAITKMFIYGYFGVMPNDNGTKYALPAKAIVSVVYYDGNYTDEELEKIEQLMPKEYIKKYYDSEIGEGMLWRTVDTANVPTFSKTLNGKEKLIIELFFELLPKNMGIMIKDMWDSTSLMLRFQYDDKKLFANQELVNSSIGKNVPYGSFLEHNMTYLFVLLICIVMLIKHERKYEIIAFAPMLLNVLSVVISNISYEARYAYPTICCSAILIIYTIYSISREKNHIDILQKVEKGDNI